MPSIRSYIALGSNLQQPGKQILRAIQTIKQHSEFNLLNVSSLYQSKAMTIPGTKSQADYINAVLLLETHLAATELLEILQQIESQQGRLRTEKWSARTLDLDILLYADKIIRTEVLTIPHPLMCERNFVLYPLAEISPQLIIPEKGALTSLLDALTWEGLEKLSRD
jgi:2-amino-4-hydroxy-6-hydroxymethyldihydropteridine diphosphokinase